MRMKRLVTAVVAGMAVMGLWGCGNIMNWGNGDALSAENVIALQSDGSVTAILVDSFDKAYYQLEGLEAMVQNEAIAFNEAQGAGSLQVERVEAREGWVNVTLRFASGAAYEAYTGATFFVGTVAEAREKGIELTYPLYDIADSTRMIEEADMAGMEQSHILIMDTPSPWGTTPVRIETFGQIQYTRGGIVKGDGKNMVRWEMPAGLAYIIFK